MFYSPLRYVGGKSKLANRIKAICKVNNISGHVIEPYAGGASVGLHLLMTGDLDKLTLNDLDFSVYAFWFSILKHTTKFCKLIEKTQVTLEEWDKQKHIQIKKGKVNLLSLGFSTFFLNRTNYSGLLNGGPLGGRGQQGKYKIDCRYNKQKLIFKIKKIAEFKDKIIILNVDALSLIDRNHGEKTLIYCDPPYFLKSSNLYTKNYKIIDHEMLANLLKRKENVNWILSYNVSDEVAELYKWSDNNSVHDFKYSANKVKKVKEMLFFSKNLKLC